MLKARKRLTKRQIKEDKLVTYYFKVTDYLYRNSRNLASVAGAVAVIILALLIYTSKQREKDQDAVVAFMEAKAEYFAQNYESAANKLENLVQTYEGTPSANTALFYLGNAYFQLKKYDQAEAAFREYVDKGDDKVLRVSAMAGVAASLEEMGQYREAAQMYQEAAEDYPDSFQAPENLMHAARCYARAGQTAVAVETLKTLLDRYSEASITNEAEILLAELQAMG